MAQGSIFSNTVSRRPTWATKGPQLKQILSSLWSKFCSENLLSLMLKETQVGRQDANLSLGPEPRHGRDVPPGSLHYIPTCSAS